MDKRNIVLVGFMGTGKTTIGRLLSAQTGMPLVDMDAMIEARAGKSINAIFAEDGEPHFRKLERDMVRELSARSGQVISTGGGIVLNPDNIADYAKTGLVVCLLASSKTILERVQHDDTRPLLAGDKQDKIVQLLETRRPLYEAIDLKINTDGLAPEDIAARIIDLYHSNNS
ncbi:MAG: shikimate kinase [Kiritimatiellales bacterium]|nr:shikimate kinase [Kiritimatiellales bacterium]MCF7864651.1 shikimate kinase [Kiritimatiellales bacterium]